MPPRSKKSKSKPRKTKTKTKSKPRKTKSKCIRGRGKTKELKERIESHLHSNRNKKTPAGRLFSGYYATHPDYKELVLEIPFNLPKKVIINGKNFDIVPRFRKSTSVVDEETKEVYMKDVSDEE